MRMKLMINQQQESFAFMPSSEFSSGEAAAAAVNEDNHHV